MLACEKSSEESLPFNSETVLEGNDSMVLTVEGSNVSTTPEPAVLRPKSLSVGMSSIFVKATLIAANHATIACLTLWAVNARLVVLVPASASAWSMVSAVHSLEFDKRLSLSATPPKFSLTSLGESKPQAPFIKSSSEIIATVPSSPSKLK